MKIRLYIFVVLLGQIALAEGDNNTNLTKMRSERDQLARSLTVVKVQLESTESDLTKAGAKSTSQEWTKLTADKRTFETVRSSLEYLNDQINYLEFVKDRAGELTEKAQPTELKSPLDGAKTLDERLKFQVDRLSFTADIDNRLLALSKIPTAEMNEKLGLAKSDSQDVSAELEAIKKQLVSTQKAAKDAKKRNEMAIYAAKKVEESHRDQRFYLVGIKNGSLSYTDDQINNFEMARSMQAYLESSDKASETTSYGNGLEKNLITKLQQIDFSTGAVTNLILTFNIPGEGTNRVFSSSVGNAEDRIVRQILKERNAELSAKELVH